MARPHRIPARIAESLSEQVAPPGCGFAAVAVVLFVVACGAAVSGFWFYATAVKITGTIDGTGVDTRTYMVTRRGVPGGIREFRSNYARYSYVVDGRRYEGAAEGYHGSRGQKVVVYYPPGSPELGRLFDHSTGWYVLFVVALGCWAFVAVWNVIARSRGDRPSSSASSVRAHDPVLSARDRQIQDQLQQAIDKAGRRSEDPPSGRL